LLDEDERGSGEGEDCLLVCGESARRERARVLGKETAMSREEEGGEGGEARLLVAAAARLLPICLFAAAAAAAAQQR